MSDFGTLCIGAVFTCIILIIALPSEDISLSERKHRKALCNILATQVTDGTLRLDQYLTTDCRAKNIPLPPIADF